MTYEFRSLYRHGRREVLEGFLYRAGYARTECKMYACSARMIRTCGTPQCYRGGRVSSHSSTSDSNQTPISGPRSRSSKLRYTVCRQEARNLHIWYIPPPLRAPIQRRVPRKPPWLVPLHMNQVRAIIEKKTPTTI